MYDLLVLGGSAQGLSAAILAQQVGANEVKVLESSTDVAYPKLVGQERLDIAYGETVESVVAKDDRLVVTTNVREYETRSCVVAFNAADAVVEIPDGVTVGDRIHSGPYEGSVAGQDVLVVGDNDRAVVLASRYVDEGANSVVLAAKGMNPDLLASASRDQIRHLEKDRKLTVLYRAQPASIVLDSDDFPYIVFGDTNPPTPEIVVDHVVFAAKQKLVEPSVLGIEQSALESGRLIYARDPRLSADLPSATDKASIAQLAQYFSHHDPELVKTIATHTPDYASAPEELSEEFYNAEIVEFDPRHSDLWVLRVRPDKGEVSFSPGQYTSLGVGLWEPKIHGALTDKEREKWNKLALRSYSISSRIFTESGYLATGTEDGCLEFYIVLVPPELDPEVTPRLAMKKPGDRIYMGQKITGHYTLRDVKVDDNVIFFATGTGEAPHNAMIVELLRRGHRGKIVSAVSVRQEQDLGYLEQHRRLEELYPNYTYIPMPTREPNVPKRYCQDLIRDGDLDEIFGDLDPEHTQAFACGNPAMIGAPDKDGNMPEDPGVVGLLMERGLVVAGRKETGQIHFDKYW